MGRNIIDLSQEIKTGMQVFPLHSPTHVIPWAKREAYGFESEAVFFNSHAGTHVDAPYHFLKDGQTIENMPLDRFWGPCVVYDLTKKPLKSLITEDDLSECEKQNPIRRDDVVLLRTGIDKFLGKREYISGYSGLSEGGAKYLVERGVKAVGTDAPGIDHPEAMKCPVHHVLLPKGIVIIENLANLETLLNMAKGKRFEFFGLPLKIKRGTGSPIRAMAVVD